jgi:transcriptional regulator with XRE-family HTH domain
VEQRIVKLDVMLKELIERGGYRRNRQAICDEVGITTGALSQYVLGKTRPSFDKLVLLAGFFGVSLDYLVFGEPISTPVDSAPFARFFEQALSETRAQSVRHSELVTRIGRVVADRVESVARELVEKSATAGRESLIEFDEIFRTERFCRRADIVTTSLAANVIQTDQGFVAGQFLEVVAANLVQGCEYRFLLVGPAKDHRTAVGAFRRLLDEYPASRRFTGTCEFKSTERPVLALVGLYYLNASMFELQEPGLATQFAKYLDEQHLLGYVNRPNDEARAAMLMSQEFTRLARNAFDELWSKGIGL